MAIVMAPILPGKLEEWQGWMAELNGPKKRLLEDFNKRMGLTRHAAWLTETPTGPVVVAMHEGPGGTEFMQKLGKSTNEFDVWFRKRIENLHGLDFTAPTKIQPPQQVLDSGQ